MDQISNSTVFRPEVAFIDCDNCIYTHSDGCVERMVGVAGSVVNKLTGIPKNHASEMASQSFFHYRDGFFTFIEDHGVEKYREMHREFDRVSRNDEFGIMNPVIPELIEELSDSIPVYIVSHTTERALHSMLDRLGFNNELMTGRVIGMDTFETTLGWLRKDRTETSMLSALSGRDNLPLQRSVLFEDSRTNIDISMKHGVGQAYHTYPDERGGTLVDALRDAIKVQKGFHAVTRESDRSVPESRMPILTL